MKKWTVKPGRIYVTTDNTYMIKNVGYKCWGIYINDGSHDWDVDWVGSVCSTVKNAQTVVENYYEAKKMA